MENIEKSLIEQLPKIIINRKLYKELEQARKQNNEYEYEYELNSKPVFIHN